MTELNLNDSNIGNVQIADEVIAVIVGTAALETEGVAGLSNKFSNEFNNKMNKRNLSKGVKVLVEEGIVDTSVSVIIKHGSKIQDVCQHIQNKVKSAIETMTGLTVNTIDVHVTGVIMVMEKEQKA